MTDHPVTYEELIAYALDDQASAASAPISAHVATCADCTATLSRLAMVRSTVQIDALGGPSTAALARVRGLITGNASAPQLSFSDSVKRVFAKLAFDSRQGYALAGLRGTADTYLLSYRVDGGSLDLQVEPPASLDGRAWQVTGQIELANHLSEPLDIAIIRSGRTVAVATTDEFGVFAVDVAAGEYDVLVSLNDATIVFPEVEVG